MGLKKLNIVFLILCSFITISAQTVQSVRTSFSLGSNAKKQLLPLNEVKPGMTGKAFTVFSGDKSTEFNVEIVGILPNGVGPKQDMIIGKISGGEAERTQVFAGMSGSPVYINGRLAGAIAYAFPFSKEAICGITPIEQMISMFENADVRKTVDSGPRSYSFSELAATEFNPDYDSFSAFKSSVPINGFENGIAGQSFQRIATPLSFNGFSQKTLDHFAPRLSRMGLMPVSGVSGGSKLTSLAQYDENTLIGGDSVSVALVRGDFSIMASGTVTLRDDKQIYAFGHPFLSLGNSSLPMSESNVVIVVPSLSNSFKIAVADKMVGSMTQDLATGIYGNLGSAPKMIPVTLNLQTSRNRKETLVFEVANDDFLTPLLLNMTVYNAITANERGLGEMTVSIEGKINLDGQEPINIAGRYAGQASARLATNSVVIPAFNLASSKFSDLSISGVELSVVSSNVSSTATLQRITVDKSSVRPGEIVEIEAFIRTDSGKMLSQTIQYTVPENTPYGKLKLTVGDGSTMQYSAVEQQFVPDTLTDLVTMINKVKKNDRMYLQTKRVTTGAIIGSNEMPNLPPSVLATLNTNRTSTVYKPIVETIVSEMEIPQAMYVISGQQELEISVVD